MDTECNYSRIETSSTQPNLSCQEGGIKTRYSRAPIYCFPRCIAHFSFPKIMHGKSGYDCINHPC